MPMSTAVSVFRAAGLAGEAKAHQHGIKHACGRRIAIHA